MKLKEKVFYIIGITLSIVFLSCFVLTQTKYATDENAQLKFYLTRDNNNLVNKGDLVKVSMYLRNTQINGINGMRGVLEYDKSLKLVAIDYIGDNWEERMSSGSSFSNSKYLNGQEQIKEIESGGKKIFCFVGNVDTDYITEMYDDIGMFTLTFDTSNCVDGTTYDISWNTSVDGGFGYKTYVKYMGDMYYVGGLNGQALQAEGTSITMTGVKPSTPTDDNQGSQNGGNNGGTNQGGSSQNGGSNGGTNQGGSSQNGGNNGGTNQGGSSQNGGSNGVTSQGGSSQNGGSNGGTNQGGSSQNGGSNGGTNQGGSSQNSGSNGVTSQGGNNQNSGNNSSGMQSSTAFPQTGEGNYLYLMAFAITNAIMALVRVITLSANTKEI